ncbi:MAG: hypothetical protein HQL98_06065 [Magnetococcales bacterium]|nr:hypothetical protein [Magnetococcales bacterium]
MRRAVVMEGRAIGMRAGLLGSGEGRRRTVLATNRVLYGLREVWRGLAPQARSGWMDGELRGFGLTLNQVEGALEVDLGYRGFEEDPERLLMLLVALRRRDAFLFGEQVLEWGRRRHQEMGMALIVADLFGALTGNVVGRGHSEGYYRDSPARRGGEAFANGLVLLGDGNLFWSRVLMVLAPRFAGRLMAVLRGAGQAPPEQAERCSQAFR